MTLALCMIVKNEEEVLVRALANAKVYADAIIVVDTGSTDATKRIAKRFTDDVYDFAWRDDFSAARNYSFSKSSCDYNLWLDADDIVPPATAKGIAALKSGLTADVVMLPYVLDETESGVPLFSYYRERIVRNRPDFYWSGRVHEAINIHGDIVRASFPIRHDKPSGRSTRRNLEIYESARKSGEKFSPREKYYYARELHRNGEYARAAAEFTEFLAEPNGFYVNKIDACLMLSRCNAKTGGDVLSPLFDSFRYALPNGEISCEIARYFFTAGDYVKAAYWFERAAAARPDDKSGAFVDRDCYGFLPYVWLTVCYDRMGNRRLAYYYHCRAEKLRPDHPSVKANREYFDSLDKKNHKRR